MGGRAAVRPAVLVRPQSSSSYGPTSVAPLVLAFVLLPLHHACPVTCTCACTCRKSSVHACSCICLHRACVRACVCACVRSLCVLRSVVDPSLPHSLRLQMHLQARRIHSQGQHDSECGNVCQGRSGTGKWWRQAWRERPDSSRCTRMCCSSLWARRQAIQRTHFFAERVLVED